MNRLIPLLFTALLAGCGGEPQGSAPADAPASVPVQAAAAAEASAASAPSQTFVPSEKGAQAVENFCYALQATGNCSELAMRLDTRETLEAKIGAKADAPDSPYNEACKSGLAKATEDKQLCRNAWARFGCGGNVMPNLLQQNPSDKTQQPVLCKFS